MSGAVTDEHARGSLIMGVWGSGLYANDTTSDVRDTYLKFLEDGLSTEEAYKKTLVEFSGLLGDLEEPFLWFALAETQWRIGRLIPKVKDKALAWIDRDGGAGLWAESPGGGGGWIKTLKSLKDKLQSPMRKEIKILKPAPVNNNLWNIYDFYAYQFHGEFAKKHGVLGKYMVIQKIGEGMGDVLREITMRIQVLDRVFDGIPSLGEIPGIRILPLDHPNRYDMEEKPVLMSSLIFTHKKKSYPEKRLFFFGNGQGPTNKMQNFNELAWFDIDIWLYVFYKKWEGTRYETIGDGIYCYREKGK